MGYSFVACIGIVMVFNFSFIFLEKFKHLRKRIQLKKQKNQKFLEYKRKLLMSMIDSPKQIGKTHDEILKMQI